MDKLIHLILLSGLVFIPGSLEENLAFTGTVTHSSTFPDWLVEHAIDGVSNGPDELASSFCSATSEESDPWLRLDLLNVCYISTVIITTRDDCLDQTAGAEIRIGNSLDNNGNNNPICAVTANPLTANTVTYSCNGMLGRYVNVVMAGRTNVLVLCEVEVYESENLALRGTATQSSTSSTWTAQHAIDGVRLGPDPDTVTYCSATTFESNPWSRLDLLDVYDISTVIITARTDDFVHQSNGVEIRIGNSLDNNGNNNPICAVTAGLLVAQTMSYSCGVMEGRYVNLVMAGLTNNLVLCEVEVYGKLTTRSEKYLLRLKFSSSVDVAAESDKILHQLQSALALNTSDFNLSWTQLPMKQEDEQEDRGSCDE